MKVFSSALLALLPLAINAGERYIVTCGDGISGSPCPASILEALTDAGATVLESYYLTVIEADQDLDGVVEGATVTLDLKVDIEKFADSPVAIDLNGVVMSADGGVRRRLSTKSPPFTQDDDFYFDFQWGHTAVRAVGAWEAGVTGKGVRVCVLDEGFNLGNPDLSPNINLSLSRDMTGENGGGPPEYLLPDLWSHGSHTSGTIAAANNGYGTIGVAPDAELVLIKVLSEIIGFGYDSWILNGIYYASSIGCDVINMSLGGLEYRKAPTHEEKKLIDGYKLIYNAAFNFAKKQGITTVVSSGNFGYNFKGDKQYVRFMADFQAVLPINACGPRNWYPDNTHVNEDFYHVAAYSSTGQESEFCAPGGQIPDGSSDGDCYFDNGVFTATRPCWVFDLVFSTGGFQDGRWWWYWAAGTSMAAPHASGVAALIISEDIGRYRGKPALVRAEMRKRAVDKGKSGRDDIFGHGFVQSGY